MTERQIDRDPPKQNGRNKKTDRETVMDKYRETDMLENRKIERDKNKEKQKDKSTVV